ncbi:hypothetical protein PENSPDRAFT_685292 [Peniophora sp. CONT]|nr:hypothetical protein PENSPDRAFT_685292 [Peniophora sp. CONT]
MDLDALLSLRRSPSPLTDLEDANEHDDDATNDRPRKRARKGGVPDEAPKRGRLAGKLSLLPTMPLDILLEIISYLPPGDLLQLARTTKSFRALLLSRSRVPIWRRAYHLVAPCPPAPKWMSEPAWAHLVFGGNFCHMCNARPVRVHPGLLKRVCRTCLNAHLLTRAEAKEAYVFCLDYLFAELVSTVESKLGGQRSRPATYYWSADVARVHGRVREILEREFHEREENGLLDDDDDGAIVSSKAQAALDKLKESIRQRTHAHKKHASKFAKWQSEVDKARTEVLESNKSTRRDEINKRLLDLGYARADVNALAQHREVRAEQPLTQRVWKRVLPLLVEELARVKAERLERERLARVEDRKHAVATVYDAWLCTIPSDAIPVAPSQKEVFELPEFAKFIEEDQMIPANEVRFPQATFDAAIPRLRELVASAGHKRHAEALAKRSQTIFSANPSAPAPATSSPSEPVEISRRFNPATTAYRSGYCTHYFGSEVLQYAHPRWPPEPVKGTFDARAFGAVALLCDRLGLDPNTTTPAELDALDPALVCTTCPLLQRRMAPHLQGRLVCGWREYAAHREDHEPKWRVLNPQERDACGWTAAGSNDSAGSDGWVCDRCAYFHARIGVEGTGATRERLAQRWFFASFRRWGKIDEVKAHMREEHGATEGEEAEGMRQLMLVKHQARARESVLWSEQQQGTQVQAAGDAVADAGVMPVLDAEDDEPVVDDTAGASSGTPMEA